MTKKQNTFLNPQNYYRFPWSLNDNGISWLEVTASCNLDCKGCYRDRKSTGHKSLEEIADDLSVFKRERKSDCMSIAGGDPLVHPEIVKIVKMVKDGGWKPIINTNGIALTQKLLEDLITAGIFGFTFHIDTSQTRHDSPNINSEIDLNATRLHFAQLVAKTGKGKITCSFNQTVTQETLNTIPAIVNWAKQYPKIVHSMVFILYRDPQFVGDFDFYANGKKVEIEKIYDETDWGKNKHLTAHDIAEKILEAEPLYSPGAFLNGTIDPNSMKWLIALRAGTDKKTYGFAGPKFMEYVQVGSHLFRGKWLSYSPAQFLSTGRLCAFLFSLFDKGMRQILKNYLKTAFISPVSFFQKTYMQSIAIIQPIDFMPDGRMNMCDSCPDMTVHKGKMYWSCRLEEIKRHGTFMTAAPTPKTHKEPQLSM